MTISEESSDIQNNQYINLMKKWESKFLLFSNSSADTTAMAITIATGVEAVLMDIVEVMALIEAGTIAIKMKEIPLLVINRIYDGIGILHIPKDKIADSGIEKVGIATHTTTAKRFLYHS